MHLFVFDSVFVSSLAWECILHSQSFFSLATEEWTSPLSSSLSSSWHSGSLDLSFYFQFHSRFHFFGRSWVSFALAPIRVHSGIVSLSLRFRFRFKLGFHRIKNYQTTWLSLSFLLCRNPMMLTTTTMRATTMVTPKTLKYREENDERKKSRQTALKLKSDRAKSLTHIKFPCAFFLLAFFLRSWDDVIGTHKQNFKLDFHNSSESSVEQCIFINLKTNHYIRNSDLNWTQQHQLLW